jgi:hypothetical protein
LLCRRPDSRLWSESIWRAHELVFHSSLRPGPCSVLFSAEALGFALPWLCYLFLNRAAVTVFPLRALGLAVQPPLETAAPPAVSASRVARRRPSGWFLVLRISLLVFCSFLQPRYDSASAPPAALFLRARSVGPGLILFCWSSVLPIFSATKPPSGFGPR